MWYDGQRKALAVWAAYHVATVLYHVAPLESMAKTSKTLQIPVTAKGMIGCREFEQELRKVLAHLYDPDYQPSEAFCTFMGCDPRGGVLDIQTIVIRAIDDLAPLPGVLPTTHAGQFHDLLFSRFVLELTQVETAKHLHMSLSSAQRVQREAIHALARILWERQGAAREAGDGRTVQREVGQLQGGKPPTLQAANWQSQVQQELVSLQAQAPDSISDVAQTLQGVLELENALISEPDVRLKVGYVQPGLVAAIHPSALRQILIAAVRRLAQQVSTGQITLYARLTDGNARITVTGSAGAEGGFTEADLVRGILTPEGVVVAASVEGDHVFLRITVPSLEQITVLVVEDNPDMVHFYRRCTTGMRYRVSHACSGQEALRRIKAHPPDVIVLDVMLPDMDGWKLLMELHEDLATRPIPIIICSVVREEELAYSLGARLYLPKPVDPQRFTQALETAFPQARARPPKAPGSSAQDG